jgi:DUF4097 and DUF4098 domain-containing protein YvlB
MRTLLLVPLAALLLACPEGGAVYRRTVNRQVPLKPGAELRVKGFNGAIQVVTWDRDEVDVVADIHENRQEEVTLVTQQGDGFTEIRAERVGQDRPRIFSFGGSAGATFTLRVPRKARAVLETSNGRVQVEGLQGGLDVRTSNGNVQVQDQGAPAVLRTSNGNVRILGLAGSAQVSTSNGRVEAQGIKGDLRVTTSNGTVEAQDVEGLASLTTSNARIGLLRVKGAVNLHTSNGSIRAERLAGDLVASTSNAGVELLDVLGRVDVGTSNGILRARGLDGQGRGIRLSTTNANITLELGKAKGEVLLRNSRHERIHVGVQADLQAEEGQNRFRLPGSTQLIELITTHGSISVE